MAPLNRERLALRQVIWGGIHTVSLKFRVVASNQHSHPYSHKDCYFTEKIVQVLAEKVEDR